MSDMSYDEIQKAMDLLRDPSSADLTEDEVKVLAGIVSDSAKRIAESKAGSVAGKVGVGALDLLNYAGGNLELLPGAVAGGIAQAAGTAKFGDVISKKDVMAAINPADLTMATSPGEFYSRAGMPEPYATGLGFATSMLTPSVASKASQLSKIGALMAKSGNSAERRIAKELRVRVGDEMKPRDVRRSVVDMNEKIKRGGSSSVGPSMGLGEALTNPLGYLSEKFGEKAIRQGMAGPDLAAVNAGVMPTSDLIVDEARGRILPRMQTKHRAGATAANRLSKLDNEVGALEREIRGELTPKEVAETISERGFGPETSKLIKSKAIYSEPVTTYGELFAPHMGALQTVEPGARASSKKAAEQLLKELDPPGPWRTTNLPPTKTRVAATNVMYPDGVPYEKVSSPLVGTTFKAPGSGVETYIPGLPVDEGYTLGALMGVKSNLQNIARKAGAYGKAVPAESRKAVAEDIKGRAASKMARAAADVIGDVGETRAKGLGGKYAAKNLEEAANIEGIRNIRKTYSPTVSVGGMEPNLLMTLGDIMMSKSGRALPRAGLSAAFSGESAQTTPEEIQLMQIQKELEKYR